MNTNEQFIDPTRKLLDAFRQGAENRPVEMLNLVRLREWARYPLDHHDATHRISGAEAYKTYSHRAAPVFERVGGAIVWMAEPEGVLIGPDDERWDIAFVARYPTAAAFLEMIADEEYRQAVVHRQAAVQTSRLIRTRPRQDREQAFG